MAENHNQHMHHQRRLCYIIQSNRIGSVVASSADKSSSNNKQDAEEFIKSLPQATFAGLHPIYQYEGFWNTSYMIHSIISFQKHFQANKGDVIVASKPKTGTTWLKALVFAVSNRSLHKASSQNHPLRSTSPHQLVPFLELSLYAGNACPDFSKFETSNPRLFATHVSYNSLPESIKGDPGVKVVYICRNPFDTVVSYFEFVNSWFHISFDRDAVFDSFCKGADIFGPFYDHVLQYWNKSTEKPQNVLFLKYEDLKDDIAFHLKRLADFLGCPFTPEEENAGVVQEIADLCSFKSLKDFDVNKTGQFESSYVTFGNQHFYRKGEVGGWRDHFTPEMYERFLKVMKEKLDNSGLTFNISSQI